MREYINYIIYMTLINIYVLFTLVIHDILEEPSEYILITMTFFLGT